MFGFLKLQKSSTCRVVRKVRQGPSFSYWTHTHTLSLYLLNIPKKITYKNSLHGTFHEHSSQFLLDLDFLSPPPPTSPSPYLILSKKNQETTFKGSSIINLASRATCFYISNGSKIIALFFY